MKADHPSANRSVATAFAAATALRHAARLTNPARRADAVWDGVGRLRPTVIGAAAIVDRLTDDGSGDLGVPDSRSIVVCARELEEIAATVQGVDSGARMDPGRIRTHALRADGPTTRERTRRRHRRRLGNPGHRIL